MHYLMGRYGVSTPSRVSRGRDDAIVGVLHRAEKTR